LIWNNNSGTEANPIVVSAYGSGAKPILTSVAVQDLEWSYEGDNLWRALVDTPPKRVLRDGIELLGSYEYPDEVDGIEYHWYWELGYLYIKMSESPAKHIIEFSTQYHALKHLSEDYVHYIDIDFQGGTSYAVYVVGSHYVTFSHCNIGKYSNKGIQFAGSAGSSHCIVEYCDINSHYIFDYSNAGMRKGSTIRGASEGILMQGPTSYSIVRYSRVKNWTHANINLTALGGSVHHNRIYNNFLTSPDIAYGGRVVLDGDLCYSNRVYNNLLKDIAVTNQFNGHNNHFHHNVIDTIRKTPLKTGGGIGIALQGYVSEVYGNVIENNLFINIAREAILFSANNAIDRELHNIIVSNNIIYNCGTTNGGVSFSINSANLSGYSDAYNIIIKNNTIFSPLTTKTVNYYGLLIDINRLNSFPLAFRNIIKW